MLTNRKQANYVDQSQIDILEKELKEIEDKFPYLASLGEAELQRLRGGIADCVDLFSNKKVKVRAKVHIPVDQYPSINFVGKLLGPGASTLRGIQDQTNTKMTILGAGILKGSTNNKKIDFSTLSKFDGKLSTCNSKQKLHLQIDSLGTPAEAYYRLSHALIEVQNCMVHELPRGVMQTYHPVTSFNWNSYMFNSAAYDSYLTNGYKNICRNNPPSSSSIYGNKYRNVYNFNKSKKGSNNALDYENFSSGKRLNNSNLMHKNGPSGDEPTEKTLAVAK